MKKIILLMISTVLILVGCGKIEPKNYEEILLNSFKDYTEVDAITMVGKINLEEEKSIIDTSLSYKLSIAGMGDFKNLKFSLNTSVKIIGEIASIYIENEMMYINFLGEKIKMDLPAETLESIKEEALQNNQIIEDDGREETDDNSTHETEDLSDLDFFDINDFNITEDKGFIRYQFKEDSKFIVWLNRELKKLVLEDTVLEDSTITFKDVTLLVKDGRFTGVNLSVNSESNVLLETNSMSFDLLIVEINDEVNFDFPNFYEYHDMDSSDEFDFFQEFESTPESFDF